MPERLTPGSNAKDWAVPILSASRPEKPRKDRLPRAWLSTSQSKSPKRPNPIKMIPMRSLSLSKNDSNKMAAIAAGAADKSSNHPILASVFQGWRPTNAPRPARAWRCTSPQRHTTRPLNVPRWRATSKVFSILPSPSKWFH